MTIPASPGAGRTRSFVELSVGKEVSGEQIGQNSQDDVLQYIHEMCATLAFLANSYENHRLAALLQGASVEAERGMRAVKFEQRAEKGSLHSVVDKAQRNQVRTVILKPTGQ